MPGWSVIFFVFAMFAAAVGFAGESSLTVLAAKMIFLVFLGLLVVSFVRELLSLR